MTELKRELSIPPDVETNGGTEILRLFISNGAMSLSMQRAFAEPEAWGACSANWRARRRSFTRGRRR